MGLLGFGFTENLEKEKVTGNSINQKSKIISELELIQPKKSQAEPSFTVNKLSQLDSTRILALKLMDSSLA